MTHNELHGRGLLPTVLAVRCHITSQCAILPTVLYEIKNMLSLQQHLCIKSTRFMQFPSHYRFYSASNGLHSNNIDRINVSQNDNITQITSHITISLVSISSPSIQLRGSDLYLAACDQVGEGSPRLTSGCQDEGVTNAKREEKSVGGIQSTEFNVNSRKII